MTWQDELQNLDAELAAGRISAEEYRQRRDAVLGRAQAGQNGPSSGGFPQQQPGTPSGGAPQQPNPFPPAFSWGDAAAQGAQQQGARPEETTQIVPNPLAGSAPQPPQGGSETTQVVNFVPQQQPPQWPTPQPQWGPQQGWGAADSVGTPWGDDLPGSTPEHGDASWMRQGPEVFETAGKGGRGKLIAGVSIGAVLLVGVIVAVIFYFTSSGGTDPVPPTAAPPPPVKTKELPAPPAPRANPPASSQEVLVPVAGPAHPWTGALDVPSLQGAKGGLLRPQSVLDTAIQGGLVDGWFNGTEGTTPKTTLLALQMPDSNAAKSVVDAYLEAQEGLSAVDSLSYQGVKVVATGGTFRTAYVAHNWVVIIDVSGSSAEKSVAQEMFRSILDQQINHLPPTVRD
ncbi:hypothetical protein GCM10011581_19500 [Saccharopolyspora subtropica]|uniref:Uncharacterized protein n=1 Tax=Saccharopolyspora thermophila TaxID=89367 RepID=A0A917NBZ0_9PSEU|nr:hypothetical protein [Saccharopolyspora subtropica]GGI82170.1 hypothetical protein GCM10011581_19500 [Saccharopolyspora subtropica]